MSSNLDVNLTHRILELEEENKKLKQKSKYGLVWEDKPEKVVEECNTKFPVLKVKEGKKFKEIINDKNKPTNILIEGDNYHALSVLNYTHKNSIDVIYIDPPYNTGNKDFIYNDKFVDSEDSFRNSKWLSFMEKRLLLAESLLSDNGTLFVSIDNNQQAELKLLCDQVFGINSFVANIGVELTKTQGMKVRSAQNGSVVKNYEYVLMFSKSKNKKIVKNLLYDKINYYDSHYNLFYDGDLKNISSILSLPTLSVFIDKYKILKQVKSFSVNSIETLCSLIPEFKEEFYKYADKICRLMDCDISLSDQEKKKIKIGAVVNIRGYFLTKTGTGKIQQLAFLSDGLKKSDDFGGEFARCSIRGDLWKGFYSDMMNVEKEGDVEFKNGKKPIRLIKQLIKWVSNDCSTVLDFFAGSGSTAHAVLSLNKEDKGNRQFILVTNNGDEKSEHKICEEVTFKRLSNIMEKDELGGNLKYLETDFIDRTKHTDNMKMRLMRACTEMLCLKENAFNLEKEVKDGDTLMYKIFSGVKVENRKTIKHTIGIYYDLDDSYLDDMRADLKNQDDLDKSAYIFSLRNVDDFIDDYRKWKGINIEEIPQKILEIYETILKNNSNNK